MRRLLIAPALLLVLACPRSVPTEPRAVQAVSCNTSPDCAASPGTRCFFFEGDALGFPVCLPPGRSCRSDADCPTGQSCAISLELHGAGALPPVEACVAPPVGSGSGGPFR